MHHFAMCKQPSRLTLSKTVVCENIRRHPTISRAQFPLVQQALRDDECQDGPSRHDCAENPKWGETGTSLIPASRAARLTRFHALTALIGKTQSSPMVSSVRSAWSSSQVPRESRTTRVLPPLPVTFANPLDEVAPAQRDQF
jgi:hypothetical protein